MLIQCMYLTFLYIKYCSYIQCLFNNTLDLHPCLTQLKQALKIEENIRKKIITKQIFKFHFTYENLIMHIIMYI